MRLQYVDCLRGLAMFLVVYYHLVIYCLPGYRSELNLLFESVHLPLFFFISGFVAYNEKQLWNFKYLWKFMRKKIESLILPAIIFLFIFCVIMNLDYWEGLISELKYGYWFTFALFGICVIWASVNVIVQMIPIGENVSILQSIAGGLIAIFMMGLHGLVTKGSDSMIFNTLSLNPITYYYFFFFCGTVAKMKREKLHWMIRHRYLFLVVVGIALMPIESNKLLAMFIKMARVLCVYNILYYYKEVVATSRIGTMLGYLGRHTLEIYFIHFFLLFGMPHISVLLQQVQVTSLPIVKGCTSLLELMIIGGMSIILCMTCIGIRRIVDTIPLLSRLCFGPSGK